MNNRITYCQIVERLQENQQPFAVLNLQQGVRLLITQRSGRALGPFLSDNSESIFWTNSVFAHPDAFRTFLEAGGHDLGGERLWIAPEIQYHVRSRSDVEATYHVPAEVDPGQYTLSSAGPERWRLQQTFTLQAHNIVSGYKQLHLERLFNPAPDPLRGLSQYSALVDGVTYAGYEQTVTLSESATDTITSQSWVLIQVNPGGTLLIPFTGALEVHDYYEPVDGALQGLYANHARLAITGQRRYKTGYKAATLSGRLAYVNRLNDGRAYLMVRHFFNNPSTIYNEEPADQPGFFGDSVHVYNDSGDNGGFGELECAGQTIGGPAGKSATTDQFLVWLYVGAPSKLNAICRVLLGIDLEAL